MPDQALRRSEGRRDTERGHGHGHGHAVDRLLRRLQDRVDRAETTWADVLRGADPSPDAMTLRGLATGGAPDLPAAVDRLAAQNRADGKPDPRDEAKAALVELQDAGLRLAARLRRP